MSSQPTVEPRQMSHDQFHLTTKWTIHGDLSESVAVTGPFVGPRRLYSTPKRVTLRLTVPQSSQSRLVSLPPDFFDLKLPAN